MQVIIIVFVFIIFYLGVELAILYYKYKSLPVLQIFQQSDMTLGQGPLIRYIAAGDSTCLGLGASSADKSYTYLIANFLAKTNKIIYENIGVIGCKTRDVLEKQLKIIIDYRPEIVTISMGGNDAVHLASPKKIFQNYKEIINTLKRETSADIYITDTQHYMSKIPKFWTASFLPWLYIRFLEFRYQNLNKKLLALEDERINIVNIFGRQPFKNRKTFYAADYYHPNDEGYENWAREFLKKMKEKRELCQCTRI